MSPHVNVYSGLRKPRTESGDSSQNIYSTSETTDSADPSDQNLTANMRDDGSQSVVPAADHSFLYKLVLCHYSWMGCTCIYTCHRKWTPELEKTVRSVQMLMEEVCDQYFKDIEHKAIKVTTLLCNITC